VNVCAKLFSTNKEGFYEACETLLEHLHLKVEETHEEIAITGFKAFVTVDLLYVLDVLYVCLLAFDLVASSIIESGNGPKCREHPFEIDVSGTNPPSLCCGLFALGNGGRFVVIGNSLALRPLPLDLGHLFPDVCDVNLHLF
jgi:hypothetical protein